MKILVAEDDLVTRVLIERIATEAGHEVVTAADGHEMLHHAEARFPDVALIDWMMPNMSGVEVVEAMRRHARGSDVYAIIISSLDGEADVARALESGIDDYLLKPISPPRLRLILRMAEFRLAQRRCRELEAPRGEHPDGLASADVMACLGPIVAVDPSGTIVEVHGLDPQLAQDLPLGTKLERAFSDRYELAAALLRTTRNHDKVLVPSAGSPFGSLAMTVTAVHKHDAIVGYVFAPACASAAGRPNFDRAAA